MTTIAIARGAPVEGGRRTHGRRLLAAGFVAAAITAAWAVARIDARVVAGAAATLAAGLATAAGAVPVFLARSASSARAGRDARFRRRDSL